MSANIKIVKNRYIEVVIYIMAVIGMFTIESHAQELPIEHYTALDDTNPLPESAVITTYQDSLGYIWIANYGFGLLRYDGQAMEEYAGLDEPLGLNVFAMEEGPYGRLWALSNDKGLAVSEQPLSAYAAGAPVQFADSLGDTPLYRGRVDLFSAPLTKDLQGAIWLGTSQEGIVRYQLNGPTTLVADTLATVLRSDSTYAPVRAMVTRQDGSVWVSIINEALLEFEDGELIARKQVSPCSDIMQLYEDSHNTLWAGCSQSAVWRLDEETTTWKEVKPAEPGQTYITGIAEVAPGLLWATTLGKGIFELDVTTGATTEYTRRNGLLDQNVWDITTDREGNVWVSQNNGLAKLRMNQAAIRTYTSRSYTGERPALVGAEAFAAEPDIAWPLPSGDTLKVLAAATSGGLSLIGADGRVEHVTAEDGLTSDLLLDVCQDAAGRVWVMTREGIDILSTGSPAPPLPNFAEEQRLTLFGGSATLTSYRIGMASACGTPPHDTTLAEAPTGEEATVCFVKAQRPAVACWVGNRWLFFDVGSGIPDQAFGTLAWDTDGHLYAGATNSGLYRSTVPLSSATPDTLVGTTNSIAPFVKQPVFERILGAPDEPFFNRGITKIIRVGQSIWVQPTGAAVHILEGTEPRLAGLVDPEGISDLANTMAYAPATNTVWLSTGDGIIETDTNGATTGRRAGQQDGLLFNTASGPPSLRVGTNGMIYHNSTAGLTMYQPARDRRNTTPPRLDFRRIKFTEDNAGSNELEISYAALSFTSERQVRYRTRLIGYEDTWSAPTSETRARYTNLSAFTLPKTYTFEVQAANNDGIWTNTSLTHDVRIQPAWWVRWWALALYASFFVGIVAGGNRLQRQRVIDREREKMHERELAQARETEHAYAQLADSHQELKRTQDQLVQQEKLASLGQLTAGIAHEIKNPLNFVNNFSDLSIELVEEIREELRQRTGERSHLRQGSGGQGKTKSEKGENPLLRGDGIAEGDAGTSPDTDLILDILDDIETNLKTIYKHGSRADTIVKSMLEHSRGGSGVLEPVNLNALLKEYVNLSFHGMRASKKPINVDIDLELDDKLGDIPLIAEDFSRVIVNLCNNAFDAMREKGTGDGGPKTKKREVSSMQDYKPKLTVRTHQTEKGVIIEIEDNGSGIPAEMKDKILQPFFTTKKGTEGTGLGLSITNDIVKAHGGTIEVESDSESYTCFKILLKQ